MDFEILACQAATAISAMILKKPRKDRGANEPRDDSWWRSGYQNWSGSAFKKRFRITRDTFTYLLGEITHLIEKEPTRFNQEPTTPEKQLAICLYRLAHGCSLTTVGDLFGVAESTASVIFSEVCCALIVTLYDRYVCLPKNNQEWRKELKSFLENWEFPCVGAWDGFHVYVSTKLKNFFSFKKRYSVSSMGFIGANKRFLWAAVGAPGSTHDSRLLKSCNLYTDIQNQQVFPNATLDLGVHGKIPVTTVGDSAFQKQPWLIKPFNENTRDPKKVYFNKRLCSARVVSEHAYGMLKGRWRILYKKTECKMKNIKQIIMACILLHNICIARKDPCKPRWRLNVNRLHLIRRHGNRPLAADADDVRMAIANWLWDLAQQRDALV